MGINILTGFAENNNGTLVIEPFTPFTRGVGTRWLYSIGTNATVSYGGCHFHHSDTDTFDISFLDNSSNQAYIRVSGVNGGVGAATIAVYRGNGTLLGSVTGLTMWYSTWYWLEWQINFSASGAFKIWFGPSLVLNGTGNTITTANSYYNVIRQDHAGFRTVCFDNLYVFDNSGSAPTNNNIGEMRVVSVFPSAAGDSTQFTASSGANYTCVDDSYSDGDSTYVYAAVAPKKDLYNMGDVSGTPLVIYAVTLKTIAKRDDTEAHTISSVLKSGTVESYGATITPTSAYEMFTDYFTADPNTGAAWTLAAVNAVQAGVRLIT